MRTTVCLRKTLYGRLLTGAAAGNTEILRVVALQPRQLHLLGGRQTGHFGRGCPKGSAANEGR